MSLANVPCTYREANEILGGRDERKIANNTFLQRGDGFISLVLHVTRVAEFHSDGSVWVGHGGWTTVTTKDRINRALRNSDWKVTQQDYVWYLWNYRTNERLLFLREGMIVEPDGTAH